MIRADREHVLGARAVGREGDVVAHVVATEVFAAGTDLAEHFLAIDLGRQLPFAELRIDAQFVELAALLGRMDGRHAERTRNARAGAGRARIPHVLVLMTLQIQTQADIVGQAMAILGQQGVGLVASPVLAPVGAAVVIHVAPGHTQHQRVIGVRTLHQQRTGHALVDTAEAHAGTAAHALLRGKGGLGREQVDDPAHGSAAM